MPLDPPRPPWSSGPDGHGEGHGGRGVDPGLGEPIRPRQIEILAPGGLPYPPPPKKPRYVLATVLFIASLLTTTTLGAVFLLTTRTDAIVNAFPFLTPSTVATVWRQTEVLTLGLRFALPALFILLCHELGHYLTCRWYRLPSTPPYFLPAPLGVGTFGAFIRIRAPIRSKRQLFDVGVAGPLAGFVALIPFLIYGIAHSRPAVVVPPPVLEDPPLVLYLPGKCLAVELLSRFFHGPLPAGTVLDLHPFALAAWFGLLATAINLLPLGQLDGGHILYAVTGRVQRRLALPLWVALAVAGLYWEGWFLWCAIVLVMGLRHPPVADEREPLGSGRTALALVALAILVLAFMPVPLTAVPVGQPGAGGGTSIAKVTGPSLTSSTSIRAPKRPPATANPRLRRSAATASTSGSATSGGAAESNDGRRPRASEAARVNCETIRNSAPAAAAARFILPASSSKMRRPASLSAARAACSGPSPRATPTSTRAPRPMAPTVSPPTRTAARETRCKIRRIVFRSSLWRR